MRCLHLSGSVSWGVLGNDFGCLTHIRRYFFSYIPDLLRNCSPSGVLLLHHIFGFHGRVVSDAAFILNGVSPRDLVNAVWFLPPESCLSLSKMYSLTEWSIHSFCGFWWELYQFRRFLELFQSIVCPWFCSVLNFTVWVNFCSFYGCVLTLYYLVVGLTLSSHIDLFSFHRLSSSHLIAPLFPHFGFSSSCWWCRNCQILRTFYSPILSFTDFQRIIIIRIGTRLLVNQLFDDGTKLLQITTFNHACQHVVRHKK